LCVLPEHNSTIYAKQNTADSKIFMTLVGTTGPDKSEQWTIIIIQQSLGVGTVITSLRGKNVMHEVLMEKEGEFESGH
jgi:hypothetical protein